jgi:hypothetical protein
VDDWALPGCRQAVADYLNEMDLDTPWFQFIADENSIVAFWEKP